MAVATKRTDDPRVVSFYESPHIHYTPDHPIRRARLSARRSLTTGSGWRTSTTPTRDTSPSSPVAAPTCCSVTTCTGNFDLRRLPWLSLRMPIVLRLARQLGLHGALRGAGSVRAVAHRLWQLPRFGRPAGHQAGRQPAQLAAEALDLRPLPHLCGVAVALDAGSRAAIPDGARDRRGARHSERRGSDDLLPGGPTGAATEGTPRLVFAANGGAQTRTRTSRPCARLFEGSPARSN